MSIPEIVLPNHTTPALAGPGQPVHEEEIGQTFFPDPRSPNGVAVDTTSLHPGKYLMTLILPRILRLLSKGIESMQRVAVVQAERLNILVDWQQEYTKKMDSVHVFLVATDDAYVSVRDDDQNANRQALNQTNSAYTEEMRANTNLIGDTAKSLQTTINQTQDAVNQQSNIATQLIQQMNSILTTFYR